jgi:hypothetical protein
MKESYSRCAATLKKWADIGRDIAQEQSESHFDWKSVRSLIKAAEPLFKEESERLEGLLRKSDEHLDPLEDPLKVDFGVHRWLRAEREEAYSDWLEWTLGQLESPALVCKVLGIREDDLGEISGKLKIKREFVFTDDQDRQRRTDLDIYWGDKPAIRVEVKKYDADAVDPNQLKRQEKGKRFQQYVLLVTSGLVQDYKGRKFIVRYWKDLCIEFRRLMPILGGLKTGMVVQKALILAFVGAVEQNLFMLPGNLKMRLGSNRRIGSHVGDHIAKGMQSHG